MIVLIIEGNRIRINVNTGTTFLPNAWYIDTIIILYLMYFIIFNSKIKKKEITFLVILLTYMAILFFLGYSITWYGNLPAFVFGMFFAKYEPHIKEKNLINNKKFQQGGDSVSNSP